MRGKENKMAVEFVPKVSAKEPIKEPEKPTDSTEFLKQIDKIVAMSLAGDREAGYKLFESLRQSKANHYDNFTNILCHWFVMSSEYWREKYVKATGDATDPTGMYSENADKCIEYAKEF